MADKNPLGLSEKIIPARVDNPLLQGVFFLITSIKEE
jgi:hypothetical protein